MDSASLSDRIKPATIAATAVPSDAQLPGDTGGLFGKIVDDVPPAQSGVTMTASADRPPSALQEPASEVAEVAATPTSAPETSGVPKIAWPREVEDAQDTPEIRRAAAPPLSSLAALNPLSSTQPEVSLPEAIDEQGFGPQAPREKHNAIRQQKGDPTPEKMTSDGAKVELATVDQTVPGTIIIPGIEAIAQQIAPRAVLVETPTLPTDTGDIPQNYKIMRSILPSSMESAPQPTLHEAITESRAVPHQMPDIASGATTQVSINAMPPRAEKNAVTMPTPQIVTSSPLLQQNAVQSIAQSQSLHASVSMNAPERTTEERSLPPATENQSTTMAADIQPELPITLGAHPENAPSQTSMTPSISARSNFQPTTIPETTAAGPVDASGPEQMLPDINRSETATSPIPAENQDVSFARAGAERPNPSTLRGEISTQFHTGATKTANDIDQTIQPVKSEPPSDQPTSSIRRHTTIQDLSISQAEQKIPQSTAHHDEVSIRPYTAETNTTKDAPKADADQNSQSIKSVENANHSGASPSGADISSPITETPQDRSSPIGLPQSLPIEVSATSRAAIAYASMAGTIDKSVMYQVGEVIRAIPEGTMELALAPEELGKLKMSMHSSDGTISVTIQAERAETLDLVRRNADELARDLRDLGYTQISFSFGGQGREQSQNAPTAVTSFYMDTAEEPVLPPQTRMATGSLDLRF